jgi:hypothetical protein
MTETKTYPLRLPRSLKAAVEEPRPGDERPAKAPRRLRRARRR